MGPRPFVGTANERKEARFKWQILRKWNLVQWALTLGQHGRVGLKCLFLCCMTLNAEDKVDICFNLIINKIWKAKMKQSKYFKLATSHQKQWLGIPCVIVSLLSVRLDKLAASSGTATSVEFRSFIVLPTTLH